MFPPRLSGNSGEGRERGEANGAKTLLDRFRLPGSQSRDRRPLHSGFLQGYLGFTCSEWSLHQSIREGVTESGSVESAGGPTESIPFGVCQEPKC